MTSSNGSSRGRRAYDAAWADAARDIAAADLRGLQVRCPFCHRAGTLLSKWEPKTPVKPLFIVHSNGNGHLKPCRLTKEQAAAARDKVLFRWWEVCKTLRLGKAFVLFSGGKDSICALTYVKRHAQRVGVQITALHVDTTAGLPEVEDYVQEVCDLLGVPLVTVRPTHDYFEIAKRWGLPGFNSRWCCETLKIAPIRRFLATQEGPKVVYDGIRAVESHVRAKYVPVWFHPSFRCLSVSPILYWSDDDVAKHLAALGLPEHPTAALGTSGECWCGAYKTRANFQALLETHPEIFAKLVEVEEAQGGKYTFLYEDGEQIPLRSLLRD